MVCIQVEPLLNLRVRNWRRFLSLPLGEMIANPPASCSGNLRIAVWLPPVTAPAAVARLLVWHARYHRALGFSCQLAYVYYNQLEAALQDEDILQLVKDSQLWIVLIEDFMAASTWLPNELLTGVVNSTLSSADRGVAPNYIDQMIVNVHSVLASTGQDTWLLSIDVDEYLTVSQPSDLQAVFSECLNGTTALILRVPALCPTCLLPEGDLPFWTEATTHPLTRYVQQNPTNYDIKSLMRPDEIISFGVHWAYLRDGMQLKAQVAANCGLLLLHVENLYYFRTPRLEGNNTDWQWVLNRM